MGLSKYHSKRNFKKTPEPRGAVKRNLKNLSFVIQKHHASRLHYDFRLEFEGVLKSWAVPKGPSLNPSDKRLAVEVEDHPLDYAGFEGVIPKGHYGAGQVVVWDNGIWLPPANAAAAFKKGHLEFELKGKKLNGKWTLIRLKDRQGGKHNWLLMKRQDSAARDDYDVVEEEPESVLKKAKVPKKLGEKKKGRSKAPPEFIKPQLAQLVDEIPEGKEWLHEIKFDGYRVQVRINAGDVRLTTRSGLDWTKKFGPFAQEFVNLPTENALLDGEMIWTDEKGYADFQGLQNAISDGKYQKLVYYAFDLLHLDGKTLSTRPLVERKKILEALIKKSGSRKILFSQHWINQGHEMLRQSCQLGLEGVVSKDGREEYVPGRSSLWQKTKCSLRQEFVIGGYTNSPKPGRPFGAILLGVYDDRRKLKYVGRVGTGFNRESMASLIEKFEKIEAAKSPFDIESPSERSVHWLKPKLAAEVEFKAWTGSGAVRHASFQGLREDKSPKVIHVEKPLAVKKSKSKTKGSSLKVTHPDRVLYPKSKTVKLEVIKYYEAVAEKMWPFMQDRPLSILRCQKTATAACFFQKHDLAGFEDKEVHYKSKSGMALAFEDRSDIVRMAQSGGLEFHAWGTQFSHIEKPDLIVFDLDPDTSSLWPRVVETAFDIRDKLAQLKLKSFVKVTGGKGLHVQVPIQPLYSWDQIKTFSLSLMKVLEDEAPEKFTTNMIKSKRKGRIFLDYLRNGYGATAIVPYSLRARETPAVAFPISWKELKPSLSPSEFTLKEVVRMLARRKDPWAGYWNLKQKINALKS